MLFKNRRNFFMKYLTVIVIMLSLCSLANAQDGYPDADIQEYKEPEVVTKKQEYSSYKTADRVTISVTGQGVAPSFARSPAQSYALAKRAATADAYRLLAEQVKGVRIDGKDTIKNMAIKSSTVDLQVQALIRNATLVETQFKDGLCEVEMEVVIDKNNFR